EDALKSLRTLCDRLGFRSVDEVHKQRETFHLSFQGRDMSITLDRVEGLGDFAEVETLASGSRDLSSAQAAVSELANRLELSEVEPRSYLSMVLERRPGRH